MRSILKSLPGFVIMLLSGAVLQAQWFTVSEVADNTWAISDRQAANIYLVEGRDSALIIDTGIGLADLRSAVKKLTDKPLIVVNTHGHPDHVGANYQFESVYIHEADAEAAGSFMNPASRQGAGNAMAGGAEPTEDETYTGRIHDTRLVPVSGGHVFNLGERWIEVMETPGHTPGGICLLDRTGKLMFSGDNNNSLVWLFLDGCLPLSEYLITLEAQVERRSEFDTLLPGHGPPMESGFILDQVSCVRSILDGSCEPGPYESFAGNAMICTSGKSSVAYDPENL